MSKIGDFPKKEARRQVKNLVEYCLQNKEEDIPGATELINRLVIEFKRSM